ncbi:MAG TPA: valine--tRNA ligase [Dictyobacter sp.]|jgi:valyl-tRNA synthetase|nr:valine--tRNA ligase [Dictyobacter sp.]
MLPNRYDFRKIEQALAAYWSECALYAYDPDGSGPPYTIDTPPATVSGELHIGHCYSYTQTDVIARFQRMRGKHVLYPMGFDDNGLPTERFAEKTFQRKAMEMERSAFIEQCLELTQRTEDHFEQLWKRLGLSVDWNYRYSTLSPQAQRVSQWSFIQLYRAGRAYIQLAPTLWCPECQTAIAQAEQEDTVFPTQFSTLAFHLQDGAILPIKTTRPELLPACVAIFVHPDDLRYTPFIGSKAWIECSTLLERARIEVPILADTLVDPAKGSGAVMCCTFGDSVDVSWWRMYNLPLLTAIGRDGRMTALAGSYKGLMAIEARKQILQDLSQQGSLLEQEMIEHSVGTHERCGTPIEYLHTRQWFIHVLDRKEQLLQAGRQIKWTPEYMHQRYEHWVENLQWDWCISRQRFLGVPFPAWTCRTCGEFIMAELAQLPLDPRMTTPLRPCACGSSNFEPEPDVMDTWATSSCSPFIIGRWTDDMQWFEQHFPASLRPQAHDIIRTWAFYTIVKALYHTGSVPWREITISGHGLSQERRKISKSQAHNEMAPLALLEQESADALRYWATSVKPGNDTPFRIETIATGRKLVTKLWNASRFAASRLQGFEPITFQAFDSLLPTDRWLLSRLYRTVSAATLALEEGDFATGRAEIERFFWNDFCDNYLELAKSRLYQEDESSERRAAQWTLFQALLTTLKLLAPYIPFITEEIYLHLFKIYEDVESIHITHWPEIPSHWLDSEAEAYGTALLALLHQVRRYKAEHEMSLGAELESTQIAVHPELQRMFMVCVGDLKGAIRAKKMTIISNDGDWQSIGLSIQTSQAYTR